MELEDRPVVTGCADPGEVCTVVTCIDGYQMARKGRAGAALGIAAFGSFIASTMGIIGITIVAPPLASFALSFAPPEYTALMIAGLSLVTYLSSKSFVKSLTMAVLGLIFGCIGMDPVTGTERFTFGTLTLLDGINIAPLAMGMYGIGEVLSMAEEDEPTVFMATSFKIRNLMPTKQDWKDSAGPIGRGSTFTSSRLLVIDELGYLPVDKQGAELPFQVISNRYECGSIVITTNRAFRDWGTILNNDNTLASAAIDRLVHHGVLVQIKGESYRVK